MSLSGDRFELNKHLFVESRMANERKLNFSDNFCQPPYSGDVIRY